MYFQETTNCLYHAIDEKYPIHQLILVTFLLAYGFADRMQQKKTTSQPASAASFKWTGAWQPTRNLLFINDASEGTLEELNHAFADWANHFAPTACAFQVGYPADEDGMNGSNELGWWKLKDPIRDWGNAILPLINDPAQELGFIWVTARSGKSYHTHWDLTKGAILPKLKKK